MTTLRKIASKYKKFTNEESIWEVIDITDDLLNEVRKYKPQLVDDYFCDVEEELSPYFTIEESENAVAEFENFDGTHGAHWSYDEVMSFTKGKGIDFTTDKFHEADYYFVLNMVYSDLGNIIKDVNTLSELALCKLNDVDFPVPFAKAYYKFKKNLEKED